MKDCNSCGKCCIKYSNGGLSASADEVALWDLLRPDISRYVQNEKIWMDPDTGKQIELCPWLRKDPDQVQYSCDIYYDRPEDCRVYPASIKDMINDDCEMLEARDLTNPKQAQKKLEKIMETSNS